MSNQPQHFYEFGPFRLDTEKRRVMRDGEIVSLTPKAFELLAVLVQRGGQLVEKEDLMQQVWPETFVEEGNLSVHIFALRKALGEDDNGQGYIETVPRQGYRFTSSVREVEPNGAALIVEKHTRSVVTIEEHEESDEEKEFAVALPESQTLLRGALKRRRFTQVAVATALLLALAVGSFIYFQRNPKQPAIGELRTIAVLPFKPLSTAADDEYFRTGMADALIIKLGSLRQIVVRPTSAVLRYTDSKEDSQAIGRALGVDAVLEGYIQRDGERIRATARLVSVRDGAQLWAGRFDDSFTNVFAVQDSISAQVAHSLSPTLINDEKRALAKRYTENSEAYLEYLKGRYFGAKRTEDGLSRSIQNFQKAIELDPNYALAYAGLADSYALLVWNIGPLNPELINKTRIAARKALELDSTLAEAHTSLAFTRCWYEWDWQGAETEYKRAIELNPNYATAHHWYGEFLVLMGRFDEGFRELKLAQGIDPLSLIISADIGKMHFFARRPEQAIEQLQKTIEMDPTFPVSHLFLAMAYRQKGMYEEAFRELEEEGKLSEGRTIFSAVLGYCYAVSGRKAEARTLLEQLKSGRSATEFEIALIHVGLGDKDQAFEWLEKAYYKRDPFLLYVRVDPNLDSLRTDPRFQTLLQRLNLG